MSIMARKRKVTLTYRDEKPEVYKLSQLTYPAVTYEQLLGMIQIVGVNQAQTRAVVSALLTSLEHYMELGHGVSLGSFGSFKPTFNSKTVKTLDGLEGDEAQKTIKVKKIQFYPGGDFKNMLKGIGVSVNEEISVKE